MWVGADAFHNQSIVTKDLCSKYHVTNIVSTKVLRLKYCVHQSIEDALHSHCVHRCPTEIGTADTKLYAPPLLIQLFSYFFLEVYFAHTELYAPVGFGSPYGYKLIEIGINPPALTTKIDKG